MATPTLNLALGSLAWLLAGPLLPTASHAQEIPPPAYQRAASQAGIPSTVLYAVALQETGMRRGNRLVPWPWSLNVAGQPRRFRSHAAACAGLRQALREAPATRVDAGLGQVNLGFHAQRYRHPCELLDPYRNLAIAAAILRQQRQPGEDWLAAIGRYHRPAGGAPAARYRQSVAQHLQRLRPAATAVPTQEH
ncbi:Uncharacterised protein [Delftia tsuruhatensis]|uniref:lytic transglycosylase domain-containing protein n=1 Tax=Delftia tsuruhatensis TaxID=180282 RepID=UPI001E76BAD2|nr:lytic transglycosylase domain-containing protein [Delftia tsuruhatensis]CAB5670809.1 Uncharacterised protein [Delftia tsuruhatensis]CAC9683086.1 Uncharacterised protein [Delftia tsuruhatensis]